MPPNIVSEQRIAGSNPVFPTIRRAQGTRPSLLRLVLCRGGRLGGLGGGGGTGVFVVVHLHVDVGVADLVFELVAGFLNVVADVGGDVLRDVSDIGRGVLRRVLVVLDGNG